MLYLGYVGFSIPFAFVLAALMLRAPASRWIAVTRRWSVVVWLFLTCGILLGMPWADAVRGWGGYWAPSDVATDPTGNVYVADSGHDRVVKLTATGAGTDGWSRMRFVTRTTSAAGSASARTSNSRFNAIRMP